MLTFAQGMYTSPEGDQYIAMEYLPKGSLGPILRADKAKLTTLDLLQM
jgi:hypothetical protein